MTDSRAPSILECVTLWDAAEAANIRSCEAIARYIAANSGFPLDVVTARMDEIGKLTDAYLCRECD